MKKRITEIDALRGFALFGILLVNVFVFHAPYAYYGEFYGAFKDWEELAVGLVVDFAGGKFLFIFAFLFGYGIYLQQQSRAAGFHSYHLRRMLVLLVFGVLHTILFWFGDILASYALLGLAMLLLIRLPKPAILALSIVLLLFSPIYYTVAVLWGLPTNLIEQPESLEVFIDTFRNGSFWQIYELRMKELDAFTLESLVWYTPKTLGLMLLGYFAASKKLPEHIRENGKAFALASLLAFILYASWSWQKMGFFGQFNLEETPLWRPALIALNLSLETMLGLAYIVGFLWLFQRYERLAQVFALAGRMALSSYILQSLICVFIFYSYGLGWYGKLVPSQLVLIAVLVYLLNLLCSWAYLKKHSMGPLERVWRWASSLGLSK